MKALSIAVLSALLAACSTPASRIKRNQAAFKAMPEDVQRRVERGEIALGFTPEQVHLAMGAPGRRYKVTRPQGESTIWVYRDREPIEATVFGGAGRSGGADLSSRVVVHQYFDDVRVIFEDNKVVEIQQAAK